MGQKPGALSVTADGHTETHVLLRRRELPGHSRPWWCLIENRNTVCVAKQTGSLAAYKTVI